MSARTDPLKVAFEFGFLLLHFDYDCPIGCDTDHHDSVFVRVLRHDFEVDHSVG